jgi:hypothetical protein
MGDLVVRCRAVGVLLAIAGLSAPTLWLTGPLLRPASGSVDLALAAALAWVLLACWAWLAATSALLALEAVATGGTRRSARLAPRLVRTLMTAACGAGLAAGLAVPSYADAGAAVPQVHLLDGLPLPDRVAGPPPSRPDRTVTVVAGDTLSAIARAHGTEWPALYRANRALIGSDPDLIQPGQHLALPHPTHEGNQ